MAFDTSDPTYQQLLKRVFQSGAQVVPFVGAGLSVYGNARQRLPLWRELLDRLVDEGKGLGLIADEGDPMIEAALISGRFIQATDLILEALGEPTFRRVVERELDDTGKLMPPAIAELVAVGWSLIVTTNLDRLIARAYLERYERPANAFTSLDTHRLAAALAGTLVSPDTAVAYIHGSIDVYPSWRLTRTHYEQLLQDPGYVEALKHLFLRNVFFVGFGLQDDDLDFLLDTVAQIYPGGVGEFYALIARPRKDDPVVKHLIRANGLRPIFYDVDPNPAPDDPFGGHRAVFECLEHLAATWATSVAKLEVILKYFPELDPYMVGREPEIQQLSDLVVADQGGVVQVVGLGGLGKTSLIQRFVAERTPDISTAGYRAAFGCSFYRADTGQFIQDLALATVGPLALSLPQQVDRICEHVRAHRMLLLLDGLEAIADAERHVRNPYLMRIVENVQRGGGTVVATTRVPLMGGDFDDATVVDIEPLSPEQIIAFLDLWGLGHLNEDAKRRLILITAGHPLALRILAGVLRDIPVAEALATIERSAVIDITDEVDPLRENRLARVLSSYFHHLSDAEIAFLTCTTAFFGPASYPLVAAALARRYPDTSVNAVLAGTDLRPVVKALLERRLLTVGTGGELSSHPTVREYFARRAVREALSLTPIHRFVAAEYLRDAVDEPDTFDDALPLIEASRQAAASHDWTLFDDLFRRRLMHGFRNHLCNNLGAWQEALELAMLGDTSSFPTGATRTPAYYPITVARSLKHLGRSAESRAKYLEALRVAASSRDPDTAKYVNNFLTLLIWRGELSAADVLVELNIRALSWIDEEWKHRWQIEHGFSTFAYLRLLQGDLRAADELFDVARNAWHDYPGERLWIYDYYPYHRAELVLLLDPQAHDEALERVAQLLAVAEGQRWPEAICRGHIQAALVLLDRASSMQDPRDLSGAERRLDRAAAIGAGISVPDVAITHLLARCRAALVHQDLHGRSRPKRDEVEASIARVEPIMSASGLALAVPELFAARGALAVLDRAHDAARVAYARSLRAAAVQGQAQVTMSRRSLQGWLGRQLGAEPATRGTLPGPAILPLVGEPLADADMIATLDALPPAPVSLV